MMDVTLNAAQLLMNGGVDSDTFNPILEVLDVKRIPNRTGQERYILIVSSPPCCAAQPLIPAN